MPYHTSNSSSKKPSKPKMNKKPTMPKMSNKSIKDLIPIKKTLTDSQVNKLSQHSVHHSKNHMKSMVRMMANCKSFTESHKSVLKTVGK